MSDTLLVACRKGLFTLERDGGWHVARVDFLGDNCSAVLNPEQADYDLQKNAGGPADHDSIARRIL